jgi:hypothetical protein
MYSTSFAKVITHNFYNSLFFLPFIKRIERLHTRMVLILGAPTTAGSFECQQFNASATAGCLHTGLTRLPKPRGTSEGVNSDLLEC